MKEFEFKRLVNSKGFFCRVFYTVIITDEPKLVVEYDCDSDKWRNAVLFGAEYFFEKYSASTGKGVGIKVLDIEDQIIDTSSAVVFYSIVVLLCEEANFRIENLAIDDTGNLIVPK